jgi:hypothetical protein
MLTGIKLPKLCPSTWARDLVESSFCSDKDRGVIMCSMWSSWRSKNDRRHGKVPIDVEEMASNFSSFQLLHTRRESNFAAHLCAQHVCSSLDFFCVV